jgi:hypothetical protein
MINFAGVLTRFRRGKRATSATMQEYSAESGRERLPGESREDFEAWQRQWAAIEKGIDELVASLRQEPRT